MLFPYENSVYRRKILVFGAKLVTNVDFVDNVQLARSLFFAVVVIIMVSAQRALPKCRTDFRRKRQRNDFRRTPVGKAVIPCTRRVGNFKINHKRYRYASSRITSELFDTVSLNRIRHVNPHIVVIPVPFISPTERIRRKFPVTVLHTVNCLILVEGKRTITGGKSATRHKER